MRIHHDKSALGLGRFEFEFGVQWFRVGSESNSSTKVSKPLPLHVASARLGTIWEERSRVFIFTGCWMLEGA